MLHFVLIMVNTFIWNEVFFGMVDSIDLFSMTSDYAWWFENTMINLWALPSFNDSKWKTKKLWYAQLVVFCKYPWLCMLMHKLDWSSFLLLNDDVLGNVWHKNTLENQVSSRLLIHMIHLLHKWFSFSYHFFVVAVMTRTSLQKL